MLVLFAQYIRYPPPKILIGTLLVSQHTGYGANECGAVDPVAYAFYVKFC